MIGRTILPVLVLLAACLAMPATATAQDSSKCLWKVTAVQAGKWGNGNMKAGLWPKGSFPANIPGVTERPDWYVNGHNCGKSQMCAGCGAGMRFLPNSSFYLNDKGENTIMIKYNKAPCAGVTSEKTFTFDWSRVRPGGYYTFK